MHGMDEVTFRTWCLVVSTQTILIIALVLALNGIDKRLRKLTQQKKTAE